MRVNYISQRTKINVFRPGTENRRDVSRTRLVTGSGVAAVFRTAGTGDRTSRMMCDPSCPSCRTGRRRKKAYHEIYPDVTGRARTPYSIQPSGVWPARDAYRGTARVVRTVQGQARPGRVASKRYYCLARPRESFLD